MHFKKGGVNGINKTNKKTAPVNDRCNYDRGLFMRVITLYAKACLRQKCPQTNRLQGKNIFYHIVFIR